MCVRNEMIVVVEIRTYKRMNKHFILVFLNRFCFHRSWCNFIFFPIIHILKVFIQTFFILSSLQPHSKSEGDCDCWYARTQTNSRKHKDSVKCKIPCGLRKAKRKTHTGSKFKKKIKLIWKIHFKSYYQLFRWWFESERIYLEITIQYWIHSRPWIN